MKFAKFVPSLFASLFLFVSAAFTAQANCGQQPYIASMCVFAGNFAPRGTAFAHGQLLAISQNDALFSLVGTIYGGDGRTTFGLPDMRGRVAVHQGQGVGLSNYAIGSKGGTELVTLTVAQIPSHNHTATINASLQVDSEATSENYSVSFRGSDTVGDAISPAQNALARLSGRRARLYSSSVPDVNMSSDSASLSINVINDNNSVLGNAVNSGGSGSHENRQPFIAMNWIISLVGVYPSRS
jgi:microcystin-dependent protein